MFWINLLACALAVCAVFCALAGALIPRSRAKGRLRLLGSLLIGCAFPVMALSQAVAQHKALLIVVGLVCGSFLVWVGFRKYRRDPEGRTPPAQIL